MIRWIVALVLLAASVAPVQAFAECACLPLRAFTPEERQQFETQYGIDWWKVMGLIPGPSQPGDWVERWWGDSSRTFYVPQQFWDPRGCASSGEKLARPRSGLHDHPDTKGEVRSRPMVGTENLLLGLLACEGSPANRVLRAAGIDADGARGVISLFYDSAAAPLTAQTIRSIIKSNWGVQT